MARFGKLFLITLLLLGLLLSTAIVAAGCGEETTTTAVTTPVTTAPTNGEVIGDRALEVLASTPLPPADYANNTISAATLAQKLANPAEAANLFVLDIRSKADFDKGHIEGATQVNFAQWAAPENLSKLPKDKKIVVVCYTGNTAAQTVMGLRMLGFDAVVLRAGMNSWAQTDLTPTVVSDLQTTDYPVVTTPAGASSPAPPATTFTKPSDADYKILAEKAAKIMSDMPTSGDYANYTITVPKLSEKLSGAEKANLFLLDIRSKADFDKGHIEGAINIPYLANAVPDNLKMLPKDKKIVVICYTGNTAAQVNTILKFLDYDSVVLRYAMMGWDGTGKETYLQEIEAANNPTVTS